MIKLNKKQNGGTLRILVGSLIPLATVAFIGMQLVDCSGGNSLATSSSPAAPIPVTLAYKAPANNSNSSNNALGLSGLSLVDTGTNLKVAVQGCSSGYNISPSSPQSIASGVVNLYRGDVGCQVELISFDLGAQTYKASNDASAPAAAVAFTSYLQGGYATFQGASTSDLISVFVNHQVTQSHITLGDSVAYGFTDLAAGTTNNFSTANVSRAATIAVLGNAAPGFSIAQAYYESTDSSGHAILNFDVACNNTLVGTGASATCDGNNLVDLVSYQLVQDNYSQGAITLAQATAAFSSPVAITAGKVIAAGGNDSHSFAVALGGWETGLLTTTAQIDGNTPHLSWVLFAQLKDTNGNIVSYIYWYVEIPTLTQS